MASGLTEADDLVVEDGSGVDDANSYSDIATVLAYTRLRQDANLAPWNTADESNQVAALIIATQYVDLRWRYEGIISFPGDDTTLPQALQWPRARAVTDRGISVPDDELPSDIVDATAEYAARAIDPVTFQARALLIDSVTQDASGRFITETLEQVGPLREQIKYSDTKATRKFADYGNADRIIKFSGLLSLAGERALRA